MSPRRKVPGSNVQRKTISPKSTNVNPLKNRPTESVHGEDDLCKSESAACADNAEPIKRLNDDNSYLHKKFKKKAKLEISLDAKEAQVNGFSQNAKESSENSETEVRSNNVPSAVPLSANPGRYVCPYCQLACAKPSVLQKHIRAHTNERPYPCAPCGFAFKTKSNLYKHCRSQAHRVKMGSGERCDSDDGSDDSAQSSTNEMDPPTMEERLENPPKVYKPKFRAVFSQEKDAVNAELRSRIQEKQRKETEERNKVQLTPTTEFLQQRISKIISDNQAIVETMEPRWSRKFLQRQTSRDRESPQKTEAKSKLALALLKVDSSSKSSSDSSAYLKVNSETHTYQPLNLTKREPDETVGNSVKEILMKSRENDRIGQPLLLLSPKKPLRIVASEEPVYEHDTVDAAYLSPGPLLGSTPLVDGPCLKKRRVHSTTIPPDPNGLVTRRLSTSSLPSLLRSESSPSSTLKSLEELSRYPMKQVNLFGGEVRVLDNNDSRVLPPSREVSSEATKKLVITKPGLHSSGGVLVHSTSSSFQMANILTPDTSKLLPLTPNITAPNLTVPGVPAPNGILTIVHGDKQIPYVPGIPGPQSILPVPAPEAIVNDKRKLSSLSKNASVKSVPNEVPKIEISLPPVEEPKKFLRPTSLPLKPGSFTPKRLHQGITPTVPSLVSPETPRPKKSYGQLFLNGHAYTYLGLKCSTKSYYCTVTRPQPMYVVQSPQLSRLSMYCNWKVYLDSDPTGLTPGQAMAQYDSRQRNNSYTTAETAKNLLCSITHSSTWLEARHESEKANSSSRITGCGLYVCEECGLGCKKPLLLKKHKRIHSDRCQFICLHCSYGFKSRSKLTKHMATSRAHRKKTSESPEVLPADSQKNEIVIDSDESEEDESDYDDTSDANSLEREAACSLLSLSETNPRTSEYVAAGLLPKTSDSTFTYPYKTPVIRNLSIQSDGESYFGDDETPIDLSQKERHNSKNQQESLALTGRREEKPREAAATVPAYLLASIAKLQEKPIIPQDLSGASGPMLQAYLTAKALRDVQFKQKTIRSAEPAVQEIEEPESPSTSTTTMPAVEEEKREEKLEEVNSVMVETSTGKRIFVNLPTEKERCTSPVGSLISKSADSKVKAEFFPPSSGPNHSYISVTEDGRSICVICNKTFTKPSQLRLHVNIHYFERPFRCEACSVSFRTKGHLQKHERSVSHHNKVSMNTTFGTVTTTNPRPFKCDDCKIAFRIHGHLAKHLRSKMHIMKLECIGKLPFGTYAELERSGINLNEIDTTDCENSLESLQVLAQKLYEKDSSKFNKPSENKIPNGVDAQQDDSSSSDGFHLPDVKSPERRSESPRIIVNGGAS